MLKLWQQVLLQRESNSGTDQKLVQSLMGYNKGIGCNLLWPACIYVGFPY